MNNLMKMLNIEAKELDILYVEDDIDTQETITVLFESFFKSVDRAKDGVEALDIYNSYFEKNQKYYDIIITDLTMPNMDGLELTRHILSKNKDQVVTIVSANDNFEHIIELINLGINFFVRKPINSINLQSVLLKASRYINNENKLKQKTKELEELNNTLEDKVDQQTLFLYQRLYYDHLTKLPKRNKLIEDIEQLNPHALLMININDFKDINSVYGHNVGDIVLIEFSKILFEIAFNRGCNLYSLGGDEFVFINIQNSSFEHCKETINIILETIESKGVDIELNGELENINLSITIGISTSQQNILNNAYLALKYATTKRLPYFIYDESLHLEDASSNSIENVKLIKRAIKDDLLVPYFQPIFLNNGDIKYETLIRIVDQDKVYSPFFFLDVAKKIRVYDDITKVVIEKSFEIFQNREEEFSINLSFDDIIDQDTMRYLCSMIKKYNVNNQLIIEILESENIDDFNIVKDFINKVKSMGVKIAIDDFGSGYSNFSYLAQLEPDFIKIDGSIIKLIDIDKSSYSIAKNITKFAQELGAKTVAEFIHNQDVHQKAKTIGVDAFQGFHLGEPQPVVKLR